MIGQDYEEMRLGRVTRGRSEAEKSCRRIMSDWSDYRKQSVEIDRLTTQANRAIVIANKITEGTLTDHAGSFGERGKSHDARVNSMDIDTWRGTPEGWRLVRREIVSASFTLDGKRVLGPTVEEHKHTD